MIDTFAVLILTFLLQASFIGQRNLVENEFVVRLLDCMFFNSFVQERGIPFRPCDLFDDICSVSPRRLKEESPQSTLDYVKRLADKLYRNVSVPMSTIYKL